MRALVLRVLPLRALDEPRTFVALFGVLFGAMACAAALFQITDPDVWWIAAAGRDMLARGAVPRVNAYSFTDPNHPWVMHEWLYGVLLAPGATWLGPAFFALVGIGCGALTFGLSLTFALKQGRHLAAAALSVVATALVAPALFGPRPSSTGFALALGMALVAFPEGWSRTRTVLAVALEWLWAQLHGSFPIGVVVLLVANLEHARERETRRGRAVTTLAAALITFVNPYGARLHGLVAHYVFGDDDVSALIHQQIEEFQPLWRAGPVWANPPTLIALGIVVALAGSALAHRRHRARAVFVLALAAMALQQARHAALAIVIGSALLVVEIDDVLEETAKPLDSKGRIWPLVLGTLAPGLVVSVMVWARSARTRSDGDWTDRSLGGSSLIALAHELPAGARVFAPFAPSSLLVWETAPRGARVFFDPRNDCYSADVLRASAAIPTDPNADRTLAAFGADWAIASEQTQTYEALARSPLWLRAAHDHEWWLFRLAPRAP